MTTPLAQYLTRFRQLRTSRLAGEEAPYKPVLLLAVLEGIEDGLLHDNHISITPELLVWWPRWEALAGR
jgi:putative restriction endonuclease